MIEKIVRSRADRVVNPHHSGSAASFFSAANGPVLPSSWSFGLDRFHTHDGGARGRWFAARMSRTLGPQSALHGDLATTAMRERGASTSVRLARIAALPVVRLTACRVRQIASHRCGTGRARMASRHVAIILTVACVSRHVRKPVTHEQVCPRAERDCAKDRNPLS